MKVLIIGGTGNISRGIVAALQSRNHEVVLFNRGQHVDPPPRRCPRHPRRPETPRGF